MTKATEYLFDEYLPSRPDLVFKYLSYDKGINHFLWFDHIDINDYVSEINSDLSNNRKLKEDTKRDSFDTDSLEAFYSKISNHSIILSGIERWLTDIFESKKKFNNIQIIRNSNNKALLKEEFKNDIFAFIIILIYELKHHFLIIDNYSKEYRTITSGNKKGTSSKLNKKLDESKLLNLKSQAQTDRNKFIEFVNLFDIIYPNDKQYSSSEFDIKLKDIKKRLSDFCNCEELDNFFNSNIISENKLFSKGILKIDINAVINQIKEFEFGLTSFTYITIEDQNIEDLRRECLKVSLLFSYCLFTNNNTIGINIRNDLPSYMSSLSSLIMSFVGFDTDNEFYETNYKRSKDFYEYLYNSDRALKIELSKELDFFSKNT